MVITWHKVPAFSSVDANTVQMVLFDGGAIEITYLNVSLDEAIVGISNGHLTQNVVAVDFSSSSSLTGLRQGLAERFPGTDINAAVTNLFYHLNFMHDYLYRLGFDEAAGNFQANNFGSGGLEGDRLLALVQHTGANNAYFGTPEDGKAPYTGYLLFTAPPFRRIDPAFDVDIIYHEYVHGLTNRLVGNPFDVTALLAHQSGAMGEGWSDAYAASITDDPVIGEYSMGNSQTGFRTVNYGMSSLTYGDFGNRFGPVSDVLVERDEAPGGIALDQTFYPEVHRDGEIWASVLWDLRSALGRNTFEQLVTDALKLTPSSPTMLDGRDAILLADAAAHNGTHQETIWAVFAARGMGFSAQAHGGDDTIVFQAFDTPSGPMPTGRKTLFFDDMESGVNGWTLSGSDGQGGPARWRQSTRRGSTAWSYDLALNENDSNDVRHFGALTSPILRLPASPEPNAIILAFDHIFNAAPLRDNFGNGYVRVWDVENGGMTQMACVVHNTSSDFEHETIDLSSFAGRTIQIQFYFDTLNNLSNDAQGWSIDNVRVSQAVESRL